MADRVETSDTPGALAAIAAWRTLDRGGMHPTSVDLIGSEHRSLTTGRTVYRLERAGPRGGTVMAKLSPEPTASIERFIYEQVLPHTGVTAPDYFGSVDAHDSFVWLFLDDVGSERFSGNEDAQRTAAGRWLGTLHSRAPDVPGAAELPDRGPRHYLECLRSARSGILENVTNPALRPPDVGVLRGTLVLLDAIEGDWASVEAFCAPISPTLTHGDFRSKNVYVSRDSSGVKLYPIDWETAGWGVPATDLAPARGRVGRSDVDLTAYCEIVRDRWPQIDTSTARDLAFVGTLFRRLIAIRWAVQSLSFPWLEKPIAELEAYRTQLEEALRQAPWRGQPRHGSGR